MVHWIGITSAHYDSHCGDEDTQYQTIEEALDGDGLWQHNALETHWVILDLGSSLDVCAIRGRSHAIYDPVDVNVYVSDNKEAFGDAVIEGISTWQDIPTTPAKYPHNEPFGWVNIILSSPKKGQYVKFEIEETEYSAGGSITWGFTPLAKFRSILDVGVYDPKAKMQICGTGRLITG